MENPKAVPDPIIIEPTVGRVVWYRPPSNSARPGFTAYPDQPCAATVAYVHNSSFVNLSVTDHTGRQHAITSVPLVQAHEPKPEYGFYCEWMPFQVGQARAQTK